MKNKHKTPAETANSSDNWNNPFADLKIELPAVPEPLPPPPPPPPSGKERQNASLSDEDRQLLAHFENGLSVGSAESGDGRPKPRNHRRLSFNIQRKGKGGRTVTIVHGLQELELMEQMELCSQIKTALGCGARFLEGDLEIQGDQRERARAWFAKNNWAV